MSKKSIYSNYIFHTNPPINAAIFSTQVGKLIEKLTSQGLKCEPLRFPKRDTIVGQLIDAYLVNTKDISDRSIHLLFSANRWEMDKIMREKINQGITLVVDRYVYSGACFTLAKNCGADLDWCLGCDRGLLKPDVVLFLDLEIEKSKKRGAFGSERYEKEEFQKNVRKTFLDMAKSDLELWKIIDADTTIEELHIKLVDMVLPVIETAKTQPTRDL